VVTVSPSNKPGFVTLSQERFAFISREDHARQLWPIPLHLRWAGADGTMRTEKLILADKKQDVALEKGFRSVVVNAGGSGFYRVRYAPELLSDLLRDPFKTLEVVERFNLVNDAWALVRAQKLGSDAYLDLVQRLSGESDPSVWSIIGGSLQALHGFTSGKNRAAFKKLIRNLVKPVFRELGWAGKPGEPTAARELRGFLAALLGTVGEDTEVQEESVKLFDSWKKTRSSVEPNVVPAIVSTLAYCGDKARFDEFLALSRAATTDQEKLRFLRALGEFRVQELYTAAIAMTLNEVKTDDAPFILGAWLTTEHAGPATWEAIRAGWGKIMKRFPASGTVRMIEGCSALDAAPLAREVEQFFGSTKVPQGDMAVAQMLERLNVNVRLRQAETPRLSAYLAKGSARA
jgi:puromycin-sensitive aminopeptidase